MSPPVPVLRTSRLVLRGWTDADRAPFAALNADPEVMAHFPSTLSRAESDTYLDRARAGLEGRGWGLWAVELVDGGGLVGAIGLNPVTFDVPFAPTVELAWRLDRAHWGRGLAPEGAAAAVDHAFTSLDLDEVVAFTTTTNVASQRVMQKLGMRTDPAEDFDHPAIAEGHPLRRHVLYRLRREW